MKIKFIFLLFVVFILSSTEAKSNTKEEIGNEDNINYILNAHLLTGNRANKFMNIYNSPNYFIKYKNLISSESDANLIKKVINIYLNSNKSAVSITEESDNVNNDSDVYSNYSYATFVLHLKSILFTSKDNWSIWLNDKKITNNDNNKKNEFYIQNIDDKKIVLQWNISEFKWKYVNKMQKIPENKYKVLENGNVELILTLYSNQSYLPFDDNIMEGKYKETDEKNMENISNNLIDKVNSNTNNELESIINSL